MSFPFAIAAGAAQLGGSLFEYLGQKETNQANYQANKDLAEQSFKQNLKMWNLQNEYNTPYAQMARAKAAGVNPAAFYGSMDSGNATDYPKMDYPEVNFANPFSGIASNIGSAFSTARSMALLESEIKMNEASALQSISKANLNDSEKEMLYKRFGLDLDKFELEKRVADANIGVLNANARKIGLDADARSIMNDFIIREKEAALSNVESDTKLKEMQANYYKSLETLTEDKRTLLKNQASSYLQSIEQMKASIMLLEQQAITSSEDAALKNDMRKEIVERTQNYQKQRDQLDATIAKLEAEARDANAKAFWQELRNNDYQAIMFFSTLSSLIPLSGGIKN